MTAATSSPYEIYLSFLRQGQLAYQTDPEGRPIFYPRLVAPNSGDSRLQWRVSAGMGTVYAITTVYERSGDRRSVALVDVDEGFRLLTIICGTDPDKVRIGDRVKLDVARDADGHPSPTFRSV